MLDTFAPIAGPDGAAHPSAGTPEELVPAIAYGELRLLAECAVGNIGHPVDYLFVGRTLERAPYQADPGPADVVVHTADTGRSPRNRVELRVTPTSAPDPLPRHPAGREEHGVHAGQPAQADAMFWSDAAVQKFLLPYLASCSGSRAGEVLNKVQDAWNRYPQRRVTVYALVHVNTFPAGTPLHLEDTLLVAFTRHGSDRLDLLTVRAFLDEFGTGEPVPDSASREVEYHRGGPGRAPQHPGYTQLRALAEWACSIRDRPHYFVFRAGENGFRGHHDTLPDVGPGDIVIPAFTPSVPAGRPGLGGVWFTPEDGTHAVNLAGDGDALFWSTGAIEQFMFPYYASKGGLQALPDLMELARVWTGRRCAGWSGAEAEAGGREAETYEGGQVMGLIHLPTSEWTDVTQQGTVEPETRVDLTRQLGVLTVDEAGGIRKHRLAEFIARRRKG